MVWIKHNEPETIEKKGVDGNLMVLDREGIHDDTTTSTNSTVNRDKIIL